MEIVSTPEARSFLLKTSVQNGHFRAFSPMKFSLNDRYACYLCVLCLFAVLGYSHTACGHLTTDGRAGLFFSPVFLHLFRATGRQNDKTNKMTCAPSKDQISLRSLIRVFAVLSMGSSGPKVSSCGQRRH